MTADERPHSGAVHTWHFSDVAARADDVSSLGVKADIAVASVEISFLTCEYVRSSPRWGVVKSLALIGAGPVGLVHTQKIEAQSEKPTWTKALEFTQFACPCGN